jgi:hypothetical protein
VTCKPVAYDKSIRPLGSNFKATVRTDGTSVSALRPSLLKAQEFLACFPPDVFEGKVPFSVFYREGRKCETLMT